MIHGRDAFKHLYRGAYVGVGISNLFAVSPFVVAPDGDGFEVGIMVGFFGVCIGWSRTLRDNVLSERLRRTETGAGEADSTDPEVTK